MGRAHPAILANSRWRAVSSIDPRIDEKRQVEKRACCSISRPIKTVDLISERQPQGRVYVCVQDQDKKDMLLALKSGNFGGADFFADALELMT
jgi:hypothetical protein